jgi:hypothetical protein
VVQRRRCGTGRHGSALVRNDRRAINLEPAGVHPNRRSTTAIGGALPADHVNYVFHDVVGNTDYDETSRPSFDGPIASCRPARAGAFGFGIAGRRSRTPDPNGIAGVYNLTTSAPTRGGDNVNRC